MTQPLDPAAGCSPRTRPRSLAAVALRWVNSDIDLRKHTVGPDDGASLHLRQNALMRIENRPAGLRIERSSAAYASEGSVPAETPGPADRRRVGPERVQ